MNQRMFFLLSVAMSIGAARCTSRPAPSPAATAPHAKVAMPVAFEQNGGQAPAPYRFLARHAEHEFAFARASVAIAISGGEEPRVLTLRFDGGRPSDPIAEQPLSGRVNYLRGRDAGAWITDMRTYERI